MLEVNWLVALFRDNLVKIGTNKDGPELREQIRPVNSRKTKYKFLFNLCDIHSSFIDYVLCSKSSGDYCRKVRIAVVDEVNKTTSFILPHVKKYNNLKE